METLSFPFLTPNTTISSSLTATPILSAGLSDSAFNMCLECDPISPFPLLSLWSWPPSSLTSITLVASSLVSTLTLPYVLSFSVKHRSDSLKPQIGPSSPLLFLLECPQAPLAVSLPSLPSFLLSSALLSPCLSWTPWASPRGPCTCPSLCVEQLLQVYLSPSPRSAHRALSRALPPSVDSLPSFTLHPPEPACFSFLSSVLVLRLIFHIVHLPSWKETLGALFVHNRIHCAQSNACHTVGPQ